MLKRIGFQVVYLSILMLVSACNDGASDKENETISITQTNDLSGTYVLAIERKEGTGSTFITSHNPSKIHHEVEIAISKTQDSSYSVELKEFSIAAPTAIYNVIYNTSLDTTRIVGQSFSAEFEKEKQEKIDALFAKYKQLIGSIFLFDRTENGGLRYTSGTITWSDYKNDFQLKEDPQAELKKYISPAYLALILNSAFNYTEGEYTINKGLNTIQQQEEGKLWVNKGESPGEYVHFKNTKDNGLKTTVRKTFKGTTHQWGSSEIINTRFSPHRINGINKITTTTTNIKKIN